MVEPKQDDGNGKVAAIPPTIQILQEQNRPTSVRDMFQRALQSSLPQITETKHFNKKEVQKLRQQFRRIANKSGKLDIEGFRQSMGVLGMVQDSLLCQRLFSVFNKSKTNEITFAEFAEGLGVLIKGGVDEKLDFAFTMTDIDGSGEVTYEELLLTVQSIMRIYSGIMGTSSIGSLDASKVKKMFNKLDRNKDGKITKEEYKRGLKRHPEIVATLGESNILQNPQSRALELLTSKLKKYRKASLALELSLEKVIDHLKEERQQEVSQETWRKLMRAPSISSEDTITDEEDSSGTDSQQEHLDVIQIIDQCRLKLKEMAGAEYGTVDFISKRLTTKLEGDGTISRVVNLEFINGDPHTSSCSEPAAVSDVEHEEHYVSAGESDNEALLKRYIAPTTKGSTVFFGHKNWDLVLNVMKGIQLTVSRCYAESREINAFDYAFKEKYTLIAGAKNIGTTSKLSDNIDLDTSGRSCRFIDYAPFVFQNLREHFGIKSEDYVHSIGPGNMLSNLMLGSLSSLSEIGTEGKSGSFFYFTSDGKYMVKTVSKEEHKLLRSILPHYHLHMIGSQNPNVFVTKQPALPSLLCRIVGCHVVRLSKHSKIGANKIYFVVMANMLKTDLEIHRRFDLKGSWVGRSSSEADRKNSKKTLKDMDFLELKQKINIGPEKKKLLMDTLLRDTRFLLQQGIIDYSMILGVHDHRLAMKDKTATSMTMSLSAENSLAEEKEETIIAAEPWFHKDDGGIRSIDNQETYVMGVIDILTVYSSRKKVERFGKTVLFMDRDGISVMPPQGYRKRFLAFFEKHVE